MAAGQDFISLFGEGWEAEVARAKEAFKELAAMVVQFNQETKRGEMKLYDAKTIREALQAGKELVDAQIKLKKATEDTIAQAQRLAEVKKQEAASHAQVTKEMLAEEKVRTQETKTSVESARAAVEVSKRKRQEAATRVESARAAKEEAVAKVQLSKVETELANKQLVLAKAMTQEAQAQLLKDRNVREAAKEADRQADRAEQQARRAAAANLGAADSLRRMSVELETLRKDYYLLSAAEREEETVGRAKLARIKELDDALKAADVAMGRHTRYVGDYARGTQGLNLAINQITREFPAFAAGLQTGFLALSNNITMVFDEVNRLRAANAELIKQGKEAPAIWKQLAKSVVSWQTALSIGVTLLTVYGAKIAEFIFGTKKATQANYDFEASLNIVNDALKENQGYIDRETKLRLAQARAAGKSEEDLNKITIQGLENRLVAQQAAVDETLKLQAHYQNLVSQMETGMKFDDANLEDAKKGLADANKQLNQLQEQRREIQIDLQIAQLGPIKKKTSAEPDLTSETVRAEAEVTRELYDELRSRADIIAEQQKAIADDEEQSLEERLRAYQQYSDEKVKIAGYELSAEYDIAQDRLSKIGEIEDRIGKKAEQLTQKQFEELIKREAITAEEANLLLSKEATVQKSNNILARYELELTKIGTDNAKFRAEAVKKYGEEQVKAVLDGLDEVNRYYGASYASDLAALKDSYAKKEISTKEFNEKRKKLEEEYTKKVLRDQVDNLKEYAQVLADAGVDTSALIEKIAELENKFNSLGSGQGDGKEGLRQFAKEFNEIFSQVGNLVSSINEAFKAASDARIAQYEREIEKIDERKEAELNAIDQAGLSEEERIRKRAETEAEYARRQQDIQKKITAEKRRQAQADKVANIMRIIGETALAVIHQYTTGDPYTATLRAALAGAAGAAQLATAIAAPLPQYKDGTGNRPHPGGEAVVGDGGKAEAIKLPTGEVLKSPAVPTVMNLPKGTEVFADYEKYMRAANLAAILGISANPVEKRSYDIEKALDKHADRLIRSWDRKKPLVLLPKSSKYDNYYITVAHT